MFYIRNSATQNGGAITFQLKKGKNVITIPKIIKFSTSYLCFKLV